MGRKTGPWSSALLSVNTSHLAGNHIHPSKNLLLTTRIYQNLTMWSTWEWQWTPNCDGINSRLHTQRCNNYLNGSQIPCIQAVGETSTWVRQQCMDALTQTQKTSLAAVQRRLDLLVCGIGRTDRKTSVSGLVQRLGWEKLDERRMNRRQQLFRQMHFSESNTITRHIQKAAHHSSGKHCQQYLLPHVRTQHHQQSFFMKAAKDWNTLLLSSPLPDAPG